MIFDGHSDIFMKCEAEIIKGNDDYFMKTHINNLKEGLFCGGIFVVYTDVEDKDSDKAAYLWKEMGVISHVLNKIEKEPAIVIAKNSDDIERAISNGKFFVLLGIEGLSGIGDDINQIETLYRLGFRHASLTWNEKNLLATGTYDTKNEFGLTDSGKALIGKMNELGMLVDVSHLNEKSFWDVIGAAKGPVIASHSNSRALCNHIRNLTDQQAVAIADSDGVIGINVCEEFVGETPPEQTLEKLIDHIDYFEHLIGIDHICCGFDFCGYLEADEKPEALKGLSYLKETWKIPRELKRRGYSQSQIDKVCYKNLLRVVEKVTSGCS